MIKALKKFGNFYHNNWFMKNPFLKLIIFAFVYNLFIETLGRQAMPGYGGLYYMVHQPVVFFVNMLIIYATLVTSCLARRQTFVFVVWSILWLSIGIVNGIILTQRMTPYTMKDLEGLEDSVTIIAEYFNKVQIAGMIAAIVGGVFVMVLLFFKAPKRPNYKFFKKSAVAVGLIVLSAFGATFGCIKAGLMDTFFGNLAYAYHDYGVPYCFINTWLNTGIHKPKGYSSAAVNGLFEEEAFGPDGTMKLVDNDIALSEDMPNILFLQLESFTDPLLFNKLEYNKDPMPYYRSLLKNYSSGWLEVPACGAGTANVEFETMTGLSVKFFGPGEYPFKSVLKKNTAESVAFDLKSIGYSTHAIHNHRAVFYNRNTVFANIGFDTFTSVEYMSDVVRTPKNWAKDEILVSQIKDALEYDDKRDYIYTISVQGHGKYPSEELLTDPEIVVTSAPDEELGNRYEYYANQVYEMDQFVKDLTDMLSEYPEPVVLVMYGDHIPALDIEEEDYDAKDLYQTQYVIWTNFDMEKQDKDLHSYELTAELQTRLGMRVGTVFKYQQDTDHSSPDFLTGLKMIGYDMLYGKYYLYGGSNPFEAVDMKMGVKDIKVDSVVYVKGKYYIKGENFTEQSNVTLDGKVLDTTYLNPTLLKLNEEVNPNDAERMKVSQTDKKNDTILSTTE